MFLAQTNVQRVVLFTHAAAGPLINVKYKNPLQKILSKIVNTVAILIRTPYEYSQFFSGGKRP